MNLKKLAIVIRGAVGAGKTTTIEQVAARFGSDARLVSLDKGWCADEVRYKGGTNRYADLPSHHRILLIELAYGEPYDDREPGATLHPDEWARELRSHGYEIRIFHLKASWETTRHHLLQRGDLNPDAQKSWYDKYSTPGWRDFPSKIGSAEFVIVVESSTSENHAADMVWSQIHD
jgi:hypothetical protein